jgi:hypothetical protein
VKRLAPFALLGLAEILIFFNNPQHFFMADSLTWINLRYRSPAEFFSGFLSVDPFFWYRPIAQRTVESVLFPLVQLNPLAYRLVGFVLFFACTLAVFFLAQSLSESRRIGWLSVLVFTPHLIHAFVTYDVSFTPELLFTLFYIGSALFYVRFLRTKELSFLILSLVLFTFGLLSKETAAALPITLLAIWFLLPREDRESDWFLLPHFAILGAYLVFAVGYLHVRHIDIDQILLGNASAGSEYQMGVGKHVLRNLGAAFSWAFGIPSGVHGYWMLSSPLMLTLLKAFRALVLVGTVCVLATPKRNLLLLGIAWFVTAAATTLPLTDHFLPYYLFAPLIGFALAVGIVLDWIYAQCSRISTPAAVGATGLLLGLWTGIHASTANYLAANHGLLGGATRVSATTVKDIKALYPQLPDGARVVLFNEDVPNAAGDQMGGALLQLAYDNPNLVTDYVSEGLSIPADDLNSGKVLAFKWIDGHFVDITSMVRQVPQLLKSPPRRTDYHLELSTTEVRAGMDSYIIRIPEIQNARAMILYALDGKVMEPIGVVLDHRGEVKLDVPAETKRGVYTFVAVRRDNEREWVPVARSIRVQ